MSAHDGFTSANARYVARKRGYHTAAEWEAHKLAIKLHLSAAELAAWAERHRLNHCQLARRLGVHRETLLHWLAVGSVRRDSIEDALDRAGIHPVEVWGDAYYAHEREHETAT